MHAYTFLSQKYQAMMNPDSNYGLEEGGMAQLEHVPPKLKSMGFDGIHGAFWIGDSTGIDSPLGGGRCRRPILLIFEVG